MALYLEKPGLCSWKRTWEGLWLVCHCDQVEDWWSEWGGKLSPQAPNTR